MFIFVSIAVVAMVVWLLVTRVIVPGARLARPRQEVSGGGILQNLSGLCGRNLWTTVLVVIGVAVLFFGVIWTSVKTPSPSEVGAWTPRVWLWLVILWGVLAAIIAINGGTVAGTLQKILAVVMIALIIVAPVWNWASSPSVKKVAPTPVATPKAKLPIEGEIAESEWPERLLEAKGTHEIPRPAGLRIHIKGNLVHAENVYADGSTCPYKQACPQGPVATRVTNEADEANSFTYAYVR